MSIPPSLFVAYKAMDTEIVPALCRWYRYANSNERESVRGQIGNALIYRLRYGGAYWGNPYNQWQDNERIWFVFLLNQIAHDDEKWNEQGVRSILLRVWSYGKRHNIDPLPLFRKLANNIYLNEAAGVSLRDMLNMAAHH